MGGWCKTQIVDISNRHEVYKAAAEIKNNYGNVSRVESPLKSIEVELNKFTTNGNLTNKSFS
jgi:hypothetical protein